jgi:lysophospholipase L1-like esterase
MGNIATLAGGVVLALVLAESVVRVVAPQPALLQSPHTYTRDTALGYRLSPGHVGFLGNRVEYMTRVQVNPGGWRGPPPTDAPAYHSRVLFVGDSFVFGQGVEEHDAVPARLQARMAEVGDTVDMINAGVPGYGTSQAVAWLERYGVPRAPDVVILGAFLGNDIQDNARDPGTRWQIKGHAGEGDARWFRPATDWLYAHSDLYRLSRSLPDALRERFRRGAERRDVRSVLERYGTAEAPQRQRGLMETARSLERLSVIGRMKNIEVVVVLFPEALQVEPWRQASLRRLIGTEIDIDWRWPNRQIDSLAQLLGVPALDLTGVFARAALARDTLYFPIDGHWTPAGHELAAIAIADWLRERRSDVHDARPRPAPSKEPGRP